MWELIFTALGLTAFEIISSIDNAVVNASVLATIKDRRARLAFLIFGGIVAVLVVRGLLPFIIFAAANAGMGISGVLHAVWSSDPAVTHAVESSAPLLLMGGGVFLVLLFLHWLFVEEKHYFGFALEKHMQTFGGVWFYTIASFGLVGLIVSISGVMEASRAVQVILAAAIGSSAFFLTDGFKMNAERAEERLIGENGTSASDWAKVLFLIVIDATFSIDGVVGAFAFTMNVLLILLGNGIGALVVLYLTLRNVERIQSYVFLKTGAMYSIGALGGIMVAEAFGAHLPAWGSPLITFAAIGYFFWKSLDHNRKQGRGLSL